MNCKHEHVTTLRGTGIVKCWECGRPVHEFEGKWYLEKDIPAAQPISDADAAVAVNRQRAEHQQEKDNQENRAHGAES